MTAADDHSGQRGDGWLEVVYDAGSVGISRVDLEGHFVQANPALCRLLGYAEDELRGMTFSDLTHPDDQEFGPEIHRQVLGGDYHTSSFEKRYLRKGGELVWVLVNPTLLRDARGEPAGYATVTVDITERKRAEQALAESEERYRTYVNHAPLGVFVTDEAGRYVDVNAAACAMTGFGRDELLTMTIQDLVVPEQRKQSTDAMGKLLTSGRLHVERTLRRKDGVTVPIVLDAVKLSDDRMMAFCKDVTERVRAQQEHAALDERVRQAQKLESLGVLAGGIAHDFNNLLVGVMGNAELLALPAVDGALRAKALRNITGSAERAADLCKQMLAYAGQAPAEMLPLSLNGLAREMGQLLSAAVPKSARMRYRLAPDLPTIRADAAQLRQIAMNLLLNAAEAQVGDEVLVEVSTSMRDCDRASLAKSCVTGELPAGRYVCLTVRDNGSGMDAQTRQRMFDPFFTTKFTGRGLGLAALHGIVRAHAGAVFVESRPGEGTTIEVLFPACEGAGRRDPAAVSEQDWRGSGTVLLVDDEQIVRTTAQKMLERIGFDVLVAKDGVEALEQYRAHPTDLRCILLDHEMPRMNGAQALRELRLLGAELPVLVLSGHSDKVIEQAFDGVPVSAFLGKPFRFSTLRQTLRDLLEG